MYESELISVIVPVYNVEQYLEKCISSIIDQTYRNLEIILVDDGSTDQSGALCDEFAQKDGRIRVIHKENGGVADARNVGIEACNGEYVSFVDSDDYIHPEMLAKLYDSLKQFGADVSICQYFLVDENGGITYGVSFHDFVPYGVITGDQALQKLLYNKSGYFVVVWNRLVKKKLFSQVRFPLDRAYEDEYVAHRLFGQCEKVICIQDALYYYLQRPNSIMSNVRNGFMMERYLNHVEVMLDRMQYLKSIRKNEYAAVAYRRGVFSLYTAFTYRLQTKQTKEAKKHYRSLKRKLCKNYPVTKYLGWKDRMRTLMICVSPRAYKLLAGCKKKFR